MLTYKNKEIKELAGKLENAESISQTYISAFGDALLEGIDQKREIALLKQTLFQLQEENEKKIAEFSHASQQLVTLTEQVESEDREIELLEKQSKTAFTLQDNMADIYRSIPFESSLRIPMLGMATKNISIIECQDIFNVPTYSTISYARKADKSPLTFPYKKVINKIPKSDVGAIKSFWSTSCVPPSGSNRKIKAKGEDLVKGPYIHVHLQRRSTIDLLKEYNQTHNGRISIATFLKYKPYYVKMKRLPTKADLIDICPHCLIFKDLLEKKTNEGVTNEEQKLFEQKELHKENSFKQMKYYIEEKVEQMKMRQKYSLLKTSPTSILIMAS